MLSTYKIISKLYGTFNYNFIPVVHKVACNKILKHTFATEIKPQNEEPDKLYKLIELEVRGNDPAVLKSYSLFVNLAATELELEIGNSWAPKKAHHDRLTLLRAAFAKKKYRIQYEMRTYFRFMQFHRLTGSTCDTFLEYIERNLPEGVAMKVTKVAIEKLPDYLKAPQTNTIKSETIL